MDNIKIGGCYLSEIEKELGLSGSGIMNATISEVLTAEHNLMQRKKLAEAKKEREDHVSLEQYKRFFLAYKNFVTYFGEELTNKYLVAVPFHLLTTREWYRNDPRGRSWFVGNFIHEGWHEFDEYKGEWQRKVNSKGYEFEIPSRYQGLKHSGIIKPILLELFPYLHEFVMDIYEIRGGLKDEFYIRTEDNKSIYVPYEPFLRQDVEGVVRRNEEYMNDYYKDGGKRAKEVLQSKVAEKLFAYMRGENFNE